MGRMRWNTGRTEESRHSERAVVVDRARTEELFEEEVKTRFGPMHPSQDMCIQITLH